MAALSDFLEAELLGGSLLDNKGYSAPHTVRVDTLDDTATYEIYVTTNGDTSFSAYSYNASPGDTENDILTNLETSINGGSDPVSATAFTDLNGNDALQIEQDGTSTPFVVGVTAGGSGVMSRAQDLYIALYTSDPADDNSGTEVSGTNYTRELASFGSATGTSPTSISNDVDIQFNTAGAGGWGTISHVAIFDAISAGNLLYHGALTTPKTVGQNDSFVFRTDDLTITID